MKKKFFANILVILSSFIFFTLMVGSSSNLEAKNKSQEKQNVIKAIKMIINQFIVISSNKKTALAVKRKKIKELYYDNVALEKFAKGALRRDWKKLDSKQKTVYTEKFNKFIISFYLGKLKGYQNNKVTYKNVKLKSSGKSALVQILVAYKTTRIALDYYMTKKNTRWYIYDFGIEGVRISSTYHRQLRQVFAKGGYNKLDKELDQLLKQYAE